MVDKKDRGYSLNEDDLNKMLNSLNNSLNEFGLGATLVTDEVYEELMTEYYRVKNTKLNDLVNEEMPKIVRQDPTIFTRYSILVPENHEESLYYTYRDTKHIKNIQDIFELTKLRFHDILRYTVELDDKRRLDLTMENYKKILSGIYNGEYSR